MQEGGPDVKAAQKIQRDRFKYAKTKYLTLDATAKARWAAANPEYHSYLFGYNFFMLEGLIGGGPVQYPQMIKSIQVHKAEVPTTGTKSFAITAVDPDKTVILIQGSARKVPKVIRGSGSVATGGSTLSLGDTIDQDKCTVKLDGNGAKEQSVDQSFWNIPCEPYVSSLSATQIGIAWSITPDNAATIGWEVTEHVEGAVHPVLVSIAAEAVVIDWAEVPDAAADVSITVVEYL